MYERGFPTNDVEHAKTVFCRKLFKQDISRKGVEQKHVRLSEENIIFLEDAERAIKGIGKPVD